jgi:hypothetical protein
MINLRQRQCPVSYFTRSEKIFAGCCGELGAQAAEFLAALPKAAAAMRERYR